MTDNVEVSGPYPAVTPNADYPAVERGVLECVVHASSPGELGRGHSLIRIRFTPEDRLQCCVVKTFQHPIRLREPPIVPLAERGHTAFRPKLGQAVSWNRIAPGTLE